MSFGTRFALPIVVVAFLPNVPMSHSYVNESNVCALRVPFSVDGVIGTDFSKLHH